jgi:multidrug efflux pump subunit AcrA (membrane-fusion protein)
MSPARPPSRFSLPRPLRLLALAAWLSAAALPAPAQPPLQTVTVQSTGAAGVVSLDAVVEPVRQTVLAAQVPGAIVALLVKAGDTVRAGQPLVRIDAQAAQQGVNASVAQVDAARAFTCWPRPTPGW